MLPGPLQLGFAIPDRCMSLGLAGLPGCSEPVLLFAIPLIPWRSPFDWDLHKVLQLSRHPHLMGFGSPDPHLLLFKDDIGCGHSTVVGGPTGHSGQELPVGTSWQVIGIQRVCLPTVTELLLVPLVGGRSSGPQRMSEWGWQS